MIARKNYGTWFTGDGENERIATTAPPVLRRTHRSPLLETLAAEHRASLRWPKGNRGFLPALRAAGLGFRTHRAAVSARGLRALGLAGLATFRLVLEALVGEKHLFAGGKYKLGATLRALQNLVMEFHGSVPP